MSTKHTPGPWTAKHTPESSNQEYVVMAGPRWQIASVDFVGNSVTEKANARLIAAAPALLEALRALLDEAEQFAKAIPPYSSSEAIASARAAIKKATGEQQ